MLRSMTGFGQAARKVSGYILQIDVKSVNHRYSDIVVRMPREWMVFEDLLRKHAQRIVRRGRLEVFVNVEREPSEGGLVNVNWPLLESYVSAAEQIRQRLGLTDDDPVRIADLLHMPDVFAQTDEQLRNVDLFREHLLDCMDEAMEQLLRMRVAEGQHLLEDIRSRLHTVDQLRKLMAEQVDQATEHMRERLRQRIRELLKETTEFDEHRFVMEVALLAERANIDEELTRLTSHCEQFRNLLTSDEPVGRKLDFLIQEMNREVNTIGSKSNYTPITNLVVELKADLEKIREQVQNIE